MAESDDILIANTGAIYTARDGSVVRLKKGKTTARRGHPVVLGFEHFWTPLVPTFETSGTAAAKRVKT